MKILVKWLITYVFTYITIIFGVVVILLNRVLWELNRLFFRVLNSMSANCKFQMMSGPFQNTLAGNQSLNCATILQCQFPVDNFAGGGNVSPKNIKEHVIRLFEEKVIPYASKVGPDGQNYKDFYYPFDILRWKMTDNYLFHVWKLHSNFNVREHIVLDQRTAEQLYQEKNLETDTEHDGFEFKPVIQKLVSRYLSLKWSDKRPQWELRIVLPPSTLNKKSIKNDPADFVLILSFHHCYGDGFSLLQMIRHALADSPFNVVIDPMVSPKGNQLSNIKNNSKTKNDIKNKGNNVEDYWTVAMTKTKNFFLILHRLCVLLTSCTEYAEEIKDELKSRKIRGQNVQWIEFNFQKFKDIKSKCKSIKKLRINTIILYILMKAYYQRYAKAESERNVKTPNSIMVMNVYGKLPYKTLSIQNHMSHTTQFFSNPLSMTNQQALEMYQDILDREDEVEQRLDAVFEMVKSMTYLTKPTVDFLSQDANCHKFLLSNNPGVKGAETFSIFNGCPVLNMFFAGSTSSKIPSSVITTSYRNCLNLLIVITDKEKEFMGNFGEICKKELDILVSSDLY